VRLDYVTCLAIYRGTILPGAMTLWCSSENRERSMRQFVIAEEELYIQLLPLLYLCLDCADGALELMKQTGMT